jgi:hypothetical protein
LYTFEELSEDAQQRAIDEHRSSTYYLDYEWWDTVFEDAKTIGALMGIELDQIYFSGFASQGDGACFTGDYSYRKGSAKAVREHAPLDSELHAIADNLQAIQRQNFYSLVASVRHNDRYSHEYSVSIGVEDTRRDTYSGVSEDTEESLSDVLRDFMRWIYKRLEAEYDWLMSDEQITESIICNGYEFTEDGEMV